MTGKLTLRPLVSEAAPGTTAPAGAVVQVVTSFEVVKGLLPKLSLSELQHVRMLVETQLRKRRSD